MPDDLQSQVPHLDQYLGLWAMHEPAFAAAVAQVRGMDLLAHIEAEKAAAKVRAQEQIEAEPYQVVGGVAVVDVVGGVTKYGSSLSSFPGTIQMRRVIRQAASDDQVNAIALRIDSPGGMVAGTGDLADDLIAVAKKKPTMAYIEDLGASGAYWLASQAGRVVANPTAQVGSIGVYGVISDLSAMYAKEGVKVHVIRAGQFKGAGTAGTEITAEQLVDWQRDVDQTNALFVGAVAAGRGLSREAVEKLADGRVHIASEAKKLGLIDAVQGFDAALASLRRRITSGPSRAAAGPEVIAMAKNEAGMTLEVTAKQTEPATAAEQKKVEQVLTVLPERKAQAESPQPATAAELKATFPSSDADFRLNCLERGATADQARDAWMERLAKQNQEQAAKIKELEAKADKPGVEPLKTEGAGNEAGDGDVRKRWGAAVDAKMKAGARDKATAIRQVVHEDPGLHDELVAATNAHRKLRPGYVSP